MTEFAGGSPAQHPTTTPAATVMSAVTSAVTAAVTPALTTTPRPSAGRAGDVDAQDRRSAPRITLRARVPLPRGTAAPRDGMAQDTCFVASVTAAPLTAPRQRRRWLVAWLLGIDGVALAGTVGLLAHLEALPIVPALAAGLLLLATRSGFRLHRSRLRLSWMDDLVRSLTALAVAFGLIAAVLLLIGARQSTTAAVAVAVAVAWLVAETTRAAAFQAARWARVRFALGAPTLVVGAGLVGLDLVATMRAHPEFGLRPVAAVDADPVTPAAVLDVPLLRDVDEAIRTQQATTVVLAFSSLPESQAVDVAITAHRLGCAVLIVPRMFELHADSAGVERLRSYPLVRLPGDPTRRATWRVKRAIDVVVAATSLVLAAPVLAACALAVLVESGRPVIFVQRRVGMDGRSFSLYKLRSMIPADERESRERWSIANDVRVGRVGRFLRRTSLDELPQLWNIVRGEMSLVGPRPERPGFVHRFSAEHERYRDRHRVPVGLTGLAQVNGLRGDTSIADRARYDNYYIAAWSLWLDARVIALTLRELVRRGDH